MKYFILTLCISAFCWQGISGNITQDVKVAIEKLKAGVQQELDELIQPITEGARKIEYRFASYKLRQAEIETFSFLNMDYSACLDLAVSLENSTQLAMNISKTAYYVVNNISTSFNDLTGNCSSWNPYTLVKCYITNINIIKDEIENVKPLIKFYEGLILKLALKVEDEFLTCIGDKAPSTPPPTVKPTEPSTAKPTEPTKPAEPSTPPTPATSPPKPDASTPKLEKPSEPIEPRSAQQQKTTTSSPWWKFW